MNLVKVTPSHNNAPHSRHHIRQSSLPKVDTSPSPPRVPVSAARKPRTSLAKNK